MSIESNRPLSPTTVPTSQPVTAPSSNITSPTSPTPPSTSPSPSSAPPKQAPPLNPQQHQSQIQQQIENTQTPQLQQMAKSVPLPSSLHAKTAPLNPDQAKARFGVLLSQTSDVEKSLRSTFFKTRGQRQKLLNQAVDSVKQKMGQLDDVEGLKSYLKSAKPMDVKDMLAQQVGAMRSDKYGSNANYSTLSANKKALVDSLYKAMMAEAIPSQGTLQVPDTVDKTVREPGKLGKLSVSMTLDGVDYPAGQPIVVSEKAGKQYIQLLLPEDPMDPDNDDFEVDKAVFEVKSDKFELTEKPQIPLNTPLFDGMVSVSDIRQGDIGDCYLLAAMYSIARQNPQAIHDMMKDNGDGTVTVRLFSRNDQTNQLEPNYITVEKSIPEGEMHAEDTPWVQILEKACAVQLGSYMVLNEGGFSDDAFEMLLGVDSSYHKVDAGTQTLKEMMSGESKEFNLLVGYMLDQTPSYQGFDQQAFVFQEDFDQVLNELSVYVQENDTLTYKNTDYDTQQLLDDLTRLNQANPLPRRDQTSVSGVDVEYTPEQEDLFNTLTQKLSEGKYLAMGSKVDIGVSQGSGHSGGESIVKGLAGQHEYAVLDTVEMNGRKFVRVANPWGNDFSRDYTLQNGQLVPKRFDTDDYSYQPEGSKPGGIGFNESWLELRDLSTLFRSYCVTG